MNVDELKALVEAVKAISGDARTVLLWYLGTNLLSSVLWFAFWVIAIERLLRPIHRLISNGHVSHKIARHLGIDESSDRADYDNRAIHEWVEKAVARERNGGL